MMTGKNPQLFRWQSVLYFTAVSVLWFVLAASYAAKGDTVYRNTHVWVFLVNSALCTVITLGKILQRSSPEVILTLEAVYLHGTIPAAVAVSLPCVSMRRKHKLRRRFL